MKPDGKAAQNKKIKRDTLMSTAFDLFTNNGLHRTTISDITEKAGLGKGTFYSYFKDKYDIHDHLVAYKTTQIFENARKDEINQEFSSLEERFIFLANHMIDQLTKDHVLLRFIHKNLSIGVFNTLLKDESETDQRKYKEIFETAINESPVKYKNPYVMTYIIIEMISSTCFDSILYDQPLPIDELKPILHDSIRAIMKSQEL